MLSPYSIKIVPCENGERFPLMVNQNDGMPLYYPCVYLTTTVRQCQMCQQKMISLKR